MWSRKWQRTEGTWGKVGWRCSGEGGERAGRKHGGGGREKDWWRSASPTPEEALGAAMAGCWPFKCQGSPGTTGNSD